MGKQRLVTWVGVACRDGDIELQDCEHKEQQYIVFETCSIGC